MIARNVIVIGGVLMVGAGSAYAWQRHERQKTKSCCMPKTSVAATEQPPAPSQVAATPTSAGAPVGASTVVAAVQPETEASLMQTLRATKDQSKRLALARDGRVKFPEGAGASERTAIIVEALFALDQAAEGRTEASTFLEAHPDDPWAKHIRSFTGLHTH